jgi:hypothetical protein
MSIRLEKPWIPLTDEGLKLVKGQLGVYQLGSETEGVTYIGCADARSLFGLKGELQAHLDAGLHVSFRLEVTSAYQTRYRELLMLHFADYQCYPRDNNEADLPKLGRLSPA